MNPPCAHDRRRIVAAPGRSGKTTTTGAAYDHVMELSSNVRGPWPLVDGLVKSELDSYISAAAHPTLQSLATRCRPWNVRDLTAHLAATFARYAYLLEQSRRGDLSKPFEPEDLSAHNLRAVADMKAQPHGELRRQAGRFLGLVNDPVELTAHQYGPIPVGLQVRFALNEVAIHRDDLEQARQRGYRPPDDVIEALTPIWERVIGWSEAPANLEPWARILKASGR
jgi:uncharacterized protein (TIGR03083 family)